jgi:hypothetical protein
VVNLTIEMPNDLARQLEGIAAVERKSVQQLALDQLQSLVEAASTPRISRRGPSRRAGCGHIQVPQTLMTSRRQSHPRAFLCR